MVQGSMTCCKYLMFIFNFLFVICGLVLIIVGCVVMGRDYTQFMDSKYVTAPVILIIVGVVIFFIAFLGCCGALKENHCMVMMFGILLFIIFIIEIAGGISAYVFRSELRSVLQENMNKSIAQQKPDGVKFWDEMQHKMKCCGVMNAEDYPRNNVTVPKSCCPSDQETCSTTNAYKQGCYDKILQSLMGVIDIVGGVALGLAAVELLGCVFAWCLASAIKRDYEGV